MHRDISTLEGNIFGLSASLNDASIVIIPVPWSVTVPTHSNASLAPYSILKASHNINTFDKEFRDNDLKICMLPIHYDWGILSEQLRSSITWHATTLKLNSKSTEVDKNLINNVNSNAYNLKEKIKYKSLKYINRGQTVAVLGGDQSTSLGLMEAVSEAYDDFSILHIDAHCDLKDSYEGFKYSHESIMFNALQLKNLSRIVQVGIRDYTKDEYEFAQKNNDRVKLFLDKDIHEQTFNGVSWHDICSNIISNLSENVYISFDIDGLDPKLCPGTGMPIPGGFDFNQAIYLINQIAETKKKIIGFDLCEVGPSENTDWDATVASRILYNLGLITQKSNSV